MEYNLSFIEAMNLVLNENKTVVGENFQEGDYIEKDNNGAVVVFSFGSDEMRNFKFHSNFLITKNILEMKYAVVSI